MCFILGALAVLGLAKLFRHRRGACGSPFGRPSFRRRRRRRRNQNQYQSQPPITFLARELDLTRPQEDAIGVELDGFFATLDTLRPVVGETRGDIATMLRADALSENDLAAMFTRHDDALRELHHDSGSRIGRIHALLDPRQRTRLAELLERGLGRGLDGPFRTTAL